jgi:RNA polymerase sigma factor (sigma-70 family)
VSGAVTFSWTLPPGPPLTAEQQRLVVEALPQASRVARWLRSNSATARQYAEDLEGVAHEGLIWAAGRYNPDRGRWPSFAYGGALMRCRMWLRAMRLRETRELDYILHEDEGDELTRLDVTPDTSPGADELLFRRQVLALVERLPERERIAVRRFLEDTTLEDVGRVHGKSRERIRQWEVSGLQLLREDMGLLPRTVRRKRETLSLNAPAKLEAALKEQPRTVVELAQITGYGRQAVYYKLKQLGAVEGGKRPGPLGMPATLWTLPT